jgi:predicted GNAT family acetyltransferase
MSREFVNTLRHNAPFLNIQKTNTGANIQLKVNNKNATWAAVNNRGNTLVIQGIITEEQFKRRGFATFLQKLIVQAARNSGYKSIQAVSVRTSSRNVFPSSYGVFHKTGFKPSRVISSPSGKITSIHWIRKLKTKRRL